MFFRSKKDDKKTRPASAGKKLEINKRAVIRARVRPPGTQEAGLASLTRLFMQSPEHQQLKIADLAWLAMPALESQR